LNFCVFIQSRTISKTKFSKFNLLQSVGLLTLCHSFNPGPLVSLSLRFSTHDSTTPVFPNFFRPLIVVSPDGFNNFSQVLLVFVVDFVEGNSGALFSADELSKSGFTFDDAVWNVHFSAQSWQVDNDFDWVDVVSNEHKLGLFSFDEVNDFVDAGGQHWFSGSWGVWFAFGSGFGSSNEFSFFISFGLWGVLGGEFEDLGGILFVEGLVELVDAWGNLQSLLQNGSLSLEFDVFWPSDKSGQIFFWLEVLADSKVFGSFFEKWVVGLFLVDSLANWGGCGSFTFSDHFVSVCFCKFDLRL